ncbi:MAG: hypothetical protein KDD36_09180 [Flavobacteriales bacterium]|nr:hypothetical protein [Flavobacteriales bacterium]
MNSKDIQAQWLADEACPADDVLHAYAAGKMHGPEQHAVERHLVDCEMCQDTVEGLALIKEPEQLLDDISAAISSHSAGGRVVPMQRSWLRYAAAVALVCCTGAALWWIGSGENNTSSEQIAEFKKQPDSRVKNNNGSDDVGVLNEQAESDQDSESSQLFSSTEQIAENRERETESQATSTPQESAQQFGVAATSGNTKPEVMKKLNVTLNDEYKSDDMAGNAAPVPAQMEGDKLVISEETEANDGFDLEEKPDVMLKESKRKDEVIEQKNTRSGAILTEDKKAEELRSHLTEPAAATDADITYHWTTENTPTYPGGDEALQNYYRNRLDTVASTLPDSIKVSCVINTDGKPTNVVVSTSTKGSTRIILLTEQMPAWNPGRTNGEPVNTPHSFYIRIR